MSKVQLAMYMRAANRSMHKDWFVNALQGFVNDPPTNRFQDGYLAAVKAYLEDCHMSVSERIAVRKAAA